MTFGGDRAAALAYEQVRQPVPHQTRRRISDVHLLGMGPELAINSLFPHSPAVLESTLVAVSRRTAATPNHLTLPAIQRSREVWLLVSGLGKAVAAAIGGADPAGTGRGRRAPEHALAADRDAAAKLPR